MTVIDAHQHFWDLRQDACDYSWLDVAELEPIRRNFLPSDLEPLLDASGIDQSIVVQTQHNLQENDWALQLAENNPRIAGVVGWVDLASVECGEQLDECLRHSKFAGVRHVTQDEPDDDFIV